MILVELFDYRYNYTHRKVWKVKTIVEADHIYNSNVYDRYNLFEKILIWMQVADKIGEFLKTNHKI